MGWGGGNSNPRVRLAYGITLASGLFEDWAIVHICKIEPTPFGGAGQVGYPGLRHLVAQLADEVDHHFDLLARPVDIVLLLFLQRALRDEEFEVRADCRREVRKVV